LLGACIIEKLGIKGVVKFARTSEDRILDLAR
jgi:hypothetical protein